ncbi:MAG: type II toxin-antitoxin system VapC family toxin [Acidobacteriota bacterium]
MKIENRVEAKDAYLDTSALAKWYLNEPFSEAVEDFLRSLSQARISSLTTLEFRCLLARRRRAAEISALVENRAMAVFEQDVSDGCLVVLCVDDNAIQAAARLMATLPGHPLRALDALHLAIAGSARLQILATADRIMANAAAALGFEVKAFLSEPW